MHLHKHLSSTVHITKLMQCFCTNDD